MIQPDDPRKLAMQAAKDVALLGHSLEAHGGSSDMLKHIRAIMTTLQDLGSVSVSAADMNARRAGPLDGAMNEMMGRGQ
jgi:hypothetical protein